MGHEKLNLINQKFEIRKSETNSKHQAQNLKGVGPCLGIRILNLFEFRASDLGFLPGALRQGLPFYSERIIS
jgi:hypothetical protein